MAKRDYNQSELNSIRDFLIFSSKNGYGNNEVVSVKESDGSTTIEIANNDLIYSDNYFGGEPYGGRTIISYTGKPVWIMVYYGGIITGLISMTDLYPYLKKQLLNPEKDIPVRGPFNDKNGKFSYNLKIEGDLSDFSGLEEIYYEDKLVFKTRIAGGLVDIK